MAREIGSIGRAIAGLAAVQLAFGCATAPEPDPASTVLWGYLRLVPKQGSEASGGGYGDRRVAEVRRVDYSHVQFAVVYAPNAPGIQLAPPELVIRDGDEGARIEPRYAATTPGAGIRIINATRASQIVSVPGASRIDRIAAGETLEITAVPDGEISVHLLGSRDTEAASRTDVWVTEGVATLVDSSGRYTLRGLEPGRHEVRAWHPRLPPSPVHVVELELGSVVRRDLEIGLDAHAPGMERSP